MGTLPTGFHIGDAICHQAITRGCICPQGRIQDHRGHPVRVLHSQGTGQGRAALVAPHMHPLDAQVASLVRKVIWLLRPEHPGLAEFLNDLRSTLNRETGDARVEFAFAFGDRISPVAEASTALTWKVNAAAFQRLRAHPAVAGTIVETRRLELRDDRRWRNRP